MGRPQIRRQAKEAADRKVRCFFHFLAVLPQKNGISYRGDEDFPRGNAFVKKILEPLTFPEKCR